MTEGKERIRMTNADMDIFLSAQFRPRWHRSWGVLLAVSVKACKILIWISVKIFMLSYFYQMPQTPVKYSDLALRGGFLVTDCNWEMITNAWCVEKFSYIILGWYHFSPMMYWNAFMIYVFQCRTVWDSCEYQR